MPVMVLRSPSASGKPTAPVPQFGAACVCCNEDSRGRTETYSPASNDYLAPRGFEVPVCDACRDHALQPTAGITLATVVLILGVCAVGLGIGYQGDPARRVGATVAIVAGAVVMVVGIALTVRLVRRELRDLRREGHHARLFIAVAPYLTRVVTRNPTLVDELRRRNPGAEFTETVAERRRMPKARVVSKPPPE